MKTTVFDEIINSISNKYDAFTVEEQGNKTVYTLVSNDRSDFADIKKNLEMYVGDTVYLGGSDPYKIIVIDSLGLYRIIFEKVE